MCLGDGGGTSRLCPLGFSAAHLTLPLPGSARGSVWTQSMWKGPHSEIQHRDKRLRGWGLSKTLEFQRDFSADDDTFSHPSPTLFLLVLDCLASRGCSHCAKCWLPSRFLHPGDESWACQRRTSKGKSLLSSPAHKEGIRPGHCQLYSLTLIFQGQWGGKQRVFSAFWSWRFLYRCGIRTQQRLWTPIPLETIYEHGGSSSRSPGGGIRSPGGASSS